LICHGWIPSNGAVEEWRSENDHTIAGMTLPAVFRTLADPKRRGNRRARRNLVENPASATTVHCTRSCQRVHSKPQLHKV
jgi:hypothetical protein